MFAPERILALDIGASKLVLAEFIALRGGGLELRNYGIAPIGLDPESGSEASAYVVTALRDLMREHNIKPGKVALSISGQTVIPKNVKLPPVAKDKISQVVGFEAQNNVPFPIEEVVWDYQLIGEDSGELSVLIVAAKEELVRKTTDCVIAAGLDPEVVDVSPLALYNAVRYNYFDLEGCTMILDMGARSTNCVFVEGNHIFIRSIPTAGNAITRDLMKEFEFSFEDAEKLKMTHAYVGFGGNVGSESGVAERTSKVVRNVMTRLHAEINRTINFYRSQQGGSQPSLVLLAGGSSVIPHTNTFLRDKLKVDVDYLNPFRNASVSENISTDRIGDEVHLLGEVVGVALRRIHVCPAEIDLMPRDLEKRKKFERRLPFFALGVSCLVLIMLIWWIYFQQVKMITVEARLAELRDKIQKLQQYEESLNKVLEQQKGVYDHGEKLVGLVRQRTRWMEMVETIYGNVLEGMWLTSIKPVTIHNDDGTEREIIEISGMAFSDKVTIEMVSEFAASLKGKSGFSKEIKDPRARPVFGTDYVIEFVIEIGYEPVNQG